MGDRMFASGGDSVHVGRRESPSGQASWEDRWSRGSDTGPREIPVDVDATAGIVRRLQARVDRHRWLLDRMQSDPLQPEPAGLPELLETVARMRRDTETLLMLHGQDPGVPAAGRARRLREVIDAAAAAAEEPRRVDVRSVPAADIAPAAATELLHVLAEVVDHVTAVHPGARVELSCAAEAPGGVVVEVRADGATRYEPEGLGGRRALGAARRLAQRSLSGLVLRAPDGGARDGGPVASVHCPASVVTLEPTPAQPTPPEPRPAEPARDHGRALAAWSARRHREPEPEPATGEPGVPASDPFAFGADAGRPHRPSVDDPLDPLSGPLPLDRLMAEPTQLEPTQLEPTQPDRTRPEPARPTPPVAAQPDSTATAPGSALPRRTNGHNGHGSPNGHGGRPFAAASDLPASPYPASDYPASDHSASDHSASDHSASDYPASDLPAPDYAASDYLAPDYVPPSGSQVDELFGPMVDLAHDPADDDVATPIFEAVASAWFREDAPAPARHDGRYSGNGTNGHAHGSARPGPRHGGGEDREPAGAHESGGPRNWETPSDVEWRAAAERAARPEPEDQTSTGLPRRRPGNQLVPPRRDGAGVPEVERPDRVPDRVRDRLSTYQRGLRQGRHRADPATSDSDPGDPAAW